jgi:hypothetical protein
MALEREVPLKQLNRSQAWFLLASIAVRRLAAGEKKWTRAELFLPAGDEMLESPELRKQGNAKQWQNTFLDRLVHAEVVERSTEKHTHEYSAADLEALRRIVEDVRNDEGVLLKRYIWPNQYPEEIDEGPIEEETLEEEEHELPTATSAVTEVAEQLSTMVKHLLALVSVSKTNSETIVEFSAFLKEIREDVAEVKKSALETHQHMRNIADKLAGEERRQLTELAAVAVETNARRKSLLNQLEAQMRKDEGLVDSIECMIRKSKE